MVKRFSLLRAALRVWAGKQRLAGDTARAANSDEVKDLRRESHDLITSPAFVMIKAANEFKDKTTTMKTTDVTETLELALKASGCDQANVVHKPRLLSDNGASYISGELADCPEKR